MRAEQLHYRTREVLEMLVVRQEWVSVDDLVSASRRRHRWWIPRRLDGTQVRRATWDLYQYGLAEYKLPCEVGLPALRRATRAGIALVLEAQVDRRWN